MTDLALADDNTPVVENADALSVVLCGTYRRDVVGLRRAAQQLSEAGCRLLSPVSLDFVAEEDGFVLAAHEVGEAPGAIEEKHLQAMRSADFVWLHCPAGYVGTSCNAQ